MVFMRTDPFGELDRLSQQVFGTAARPAVMPMDAWRDGDRFVIEFDLPGVDPGSIDLDVERNVLTVRADRPMRELTGEQLAAERPRGVFSRQLILGDNLDLDQISAGYRDGVLTLKVPVAERAKPRKISIEVSDDRVIEGTSQANGGDQVGDRASATG
jgi:HSP20 family protein